MITPSFGRDLHLFRELHESVLRFTDPTVTHHVFVPDADLNDFLAIPSGRVVVHRARDFLPADLFFLQEFTRVLPGRLRKIQAVRRSGLWPPLRGWILQQALKLAAAAAMDSDVVVFADSDVMLIRPVAAEDFMQDGAVLTYRKIGGVTRNMELHLKWLERACALLSLPRDVSPPTDDYVAGFVAWDPKIVRDIRSRIEGATGSPWLDSVLSSIHFSECMLYGTYVNTLGGSAQFTEDSRCFSYWEASPLERPDIAALVSRVLPTDVALQIQSTSNTEMAVRRAIAVQFANPRGVG